ncbi:hypothetical protein [Burkholderia sp. BCC0405]|uniref:hypothetical protein n=1 Tax=Burkholderia sp. BCC0405 TaxID=2676298 RepID=UPI00158C9774|nr:hypothetical protein [Burkholderia sp. BCC0405]
MNEHGIDLNWFNRLASARNSIVHVGIFLALDTTEPPWGQLLAKGNIKQFGGPRTDGRFSSVEVMDGFLGCKEAMQAHLLALFETTKRSRFRAPPSEHGEVRSMPVNSHRRI